MGFTNSTVFSSFCPSPFSLSEPSYAKGSAETSIFLHTPPDPPTEGGKEVLRHSLVLPPSLNSEGYNHPQERALLRSLNGATQPGRCCLTNGEPALWVLNQP